MYTCKHTYTQAHTHTVSREPLVLRYGLLHDVILIAVLLHDVRIAFWGKKGK
jgi:hypothetical protein